MSAMSRFIPRYETLETKDVPSAVGLFAVGTGEGALPRVAVFNSTTGARLQDFVPFEATFTGGVTTALGDVNSDGIPDLIVGAGPGGGPRVRIFNGASIVNQTVAFDQNNVNNLLADFFAFESTQRGGVFVSSGTFAGLVNDDVVVGAGPGGGPRVRILDGTRITTMGRSFTSQVQLDVVADFFAFESTFRNGVSVAATQGVIGFSNLIVAPGFGGGPRVRELSGLAISTQTTAFTSQGTTDTLNDFFAFDQSLRSGVFVAAADINNDGTFEIVASTGKGTPTVVRVFNGANLLSKGKNFTGFQAGDVLDEFAPNGGNYTNGATVGSSFLNGPNDLVLVGIGDANLVNQTTVFQYSTGSGFNQRQALFAVTVDPSFRGRPNSSN